MSDNKNKNIQDRGWSNMRSILDNELPEKEKKRRPLVWFFFGSGVVAFVAIASLFILPNFDKNSQAIQFEESNAKENNVVISTELQNEGTTEVLKNKNVSSEEEYQIPLNNKTLHLNNTTEENKEQQKVSTKSSISSKTRNEKSSLIANNSKDHPNRQLLNKDVSVILNQQTQQKESRDIKTKEADSKASPSKTKKYSEPEKNEILETIKEDLFPRSVLIPTQRLPLFPHILIGNKRGESEEAKPVIALQSNNSISPYLFAAGMHRTSLKRWGFGLGVGLSYKSNNLIVYAEAGYFKSKYNTRSLLFDSSADKSPDVFENDPDINILAPVSSVELDVSNFSKITTSTEEFTLDLGIRKQLFKKMNIDMGISFAILLNATNESLLLNLDPISNQTNKEAFYYEVTSSELHDSGAYASYDILPHIGFEYEIFSKVHLGINYNYGLKNLITNTELGTLRSLSTNESVYRRNLSAKLRYQF